MSENDFNLGDVVPIKLDTKVEVKADLTESAQIVSKKLSDIIRDACGVAIDTTRALVSPFNAWCNAWAESILAKNKIKMEELKGEQERVEIMNRLKNEILSSIDPLRLAEIRRFAEALNDVQDEINDLGEEHVSSEPVNEDFFNFWQHATQLASEDGLRRILAKLLVEEAKESAFSIRTLDTLVKSSKHERELFSKYTMAQIGDGILAIRVRNGVFTENDYPDIITLQRSGFISESSFSITIRSEDNAQIDVKFGMSDFTLVPDRQIAVSIYPFTTAGSELLKIITPDYSSFDATEAAKNIALEIKSQNQEINMLLFQQKGTIPVEAWNL